MNKNIINRDEDGIWHGELTWFYANGNISQIVNYHHGKLNGYGTWFAEDKSIDFKQYYTMNKKIYIENHWSKQIEIMI